MPSLKEGWKQLDKMIEVENRDASKEMREEIIKLIDKEIEDYKREELATSNEEYRNWLKAGESALKELKSKIEMVIE